MFTVVHFLLARCVMVILITNIIYRCEGKFISSSWKIMEDTIQFNSIVYSSQNISINKYNINMENKYINN